VQPAAVVWRKCTENLSCVGGRDAGRTNALPKVLICKKSLKIWEKYLKFRAKMAPNVV